MRIVMFYPSVELGGAELLIARVATALSCKGFSVAVLDSKNKIIHNNISNENVEKIVVNVDNPIKIDCDYIVAFLSHMVDMHRWIEPSSNGKVFFWSIHPFNTIYLPPYIGGLVASKGLFFVKIINKVFFKTEYLRREQALFILNKNQAMACMDGENSHLPNIYYKQAYNWPFLPVPYAGLDQAIERVNVQSEINVFWIGRLVDFKIHILKYLIDSMSKSKHSVKLHIVGDGDCINDINALLDTLNIKCKMYGGLSNKEMHACLNDNADIVFAMGTSALEAGARKIPTILVDASYQEVSFNYEFNWLYNSKKFCLGHILTGKKIGNGMSFDTVITELVTNGASHAEKTRQYVRENHSMSSVVDKLITYLESSNLEYKYYIQEIGVARPWLLTVAKTLKRWLKK